jgi:glycerol uptake facilitator
VALPGNYGNVNWYWWLPIVAPIVGAVIGALVYDFFINHVLQARDVPPTHDVETRGEVVEEL